MPILPPNSFFGFPHTWLPGYWSRGARCLTAFQGNTRGTVNRKLSMDNLWEQRVCYFPSTAPVNHSQALSEGLCVWCSLSEALNYAFLVLTWLFLDGIHFVSWTALTQIHGDNDVRADVSEFDATPLLLILRKPSCCTVIVWLPSLRR